jgi:hypothetical protein
MSKSQFYDEFTLSEAAVKLGKKAMDLGLIRSFLVRYFPDSQQFYISNENEGDPLTPEEAYLRLKKLVEKSEQSSVVSQESK